jgi:Icc-related predicted phosphoesterase
MDFTNKEVRKKYQRDYYHNKRKSQRYSKKLELLKLHGSKCSLCGYDKCTAALEFHHTDRNLKKFAIGETFRSFEKLKEEAMKCIILCANCHAEQHFSPIF